MFAHNTIALLLVSTCFCVSSAVAQTVRFDIQPIPTPGVNIPTTLVPTFTTATVAPGGFVPYEIAVFVPVDPNFPVIQGLAGFNVDIQTGLGVSQPPLTAFATAITFAFTSNLSLGTPSGSNILDISAQQELSGIITPGFALSRRQVLGQGQLVTPNREGNFPVLINGTGQLLTSQTDQITQTTLTATPETPIGFTIITQATTTAPSDPTDGDSTNSGNGIDTETLPDLCAPLLSQVLMCCVVGLYIMKLLWRS